MFRWYVPFLRNGDGEEADDRRMKRIVLAQPHPRNHMYVPPVLMSIITPTYILPPSSPGYIFVDRYHERVH